MNDIIDWLAQNRREIRGNTQLQSAGAASRSAVITRHYRWSLPEVWSACTERERLARWFGRVEGTLSVGESFSIDAGMPHRIRCKLVVCEPEQRLLFTWSYEGDPLDPPDEVEVRFTPDTEGVLLEIEHRSGVLYPWATGVGSGWESWIWGIEAALAGDPGTQHGAPPEVNAQIDARWSQIVEPSALLNSAGARRILRLQRKFRQPQASVWSGLLASLARWYPARIEGAIAVGAPLRFSYEDGTSLQGTIVVLDAPRLFVLREETDEMRIELSQGHGGTLLTFEHEFDAPGAPASFATGWDRCLAELEQALAGTSSPPEDEAQRAARRRAYAQVFGEVS